MAKRRAVSKQKPTTIYMNAAARRELDKALKILKKLQRELRRRVR
jgi:hypothetical protein